MGEPAVSGHLSQEGLYFSLWWGQCPPRFSEWCAVHRSGTCENGLWKRFGSASKTEEISKNKALMDEAYGLGRKIVTE